MNKEKEAFFRKFREYIFNNDQEMFEAAVRYASSKTGEDPSIKLEEMKEFPKSKFVEDFIGSWK